MESLLAYMGTVLLGWFVVTMSIKFGTWLADRKIKKLQ